MSPARFLCPLLTFMLIYHTIGYLHSSRHQTYVSLRKLMAVGTVSSDLTLPGENESTDLAFFYLKEELKLEDSTMMKIIRSHSWILYLRVESNLKPTVSVLQKAGFSPLEIRCLVDRIPSVLVSANDISTYSRQIHTYTLMHIYFRLSMPYGHSLRSFTHYRKCFS
jgi:hypothetical protein